MSFTYSQVRLEELLNEAKDMIAEELNIPALDGYTFVMRPRKSWAKRTLDFLVGRRTESRTVYVPEDNESDQGVPYCCSLLRLPQEALEDPIPTDSAADDTGDDPSKPSRGLLVDTRR